MNVQALPNSACKVLHTKDIKNWGRVPFRMGKLSDRQPLVQTLAEGQIYNAIILFNIIAPNHV